MQQHSFRAADAAAAEERAVRARRTKSQETERRADRQREREGESETTGVPESIFSSLVTLSSLHSSLSPICQRLPPLQQVAQPTRWTPPSLSIPLTYSDNLTPDSDLVSENLRQQPAAQRSSSVLTHSIYLSICLPSYPLLLSRYPNKNCYSTNEWSAAAAAAAAATTVGFSYSLNRYTIREYDRARNVRPSVRLSDPILWPAIREPSLPFLLSFFPSFSL